MAMRHEVRSATILPRHRRDGGRENTGLIGILQEAALPLPNSENRSANASPRSGNRKPGDLVAVKLRSTENKPIPHAQRGWALRTLGTGFTVRFR
jgi:hypothetical protein